jgi:Tol biopolymer transport system component
VLACGAAGPSCREAREAGPLVERLTHNDYEDFHPSWSPDGRAILFDAREGDSATVRVLELGASTPRIVAGGDHPHWLPDGAHVTAVQYLSSGAEVVVVIALDGTSTRVLSDPAMRSGAGVPSPDGRLVAFASDRDGDWELFVVPTADGPERRLTDNDARDFFNSWAPHGSAIAYQTDREGEWSGRVLSLSNGADHRLPNDSLPATALRWSPDGNRLAFTAATADLRALYLVDADGGRLVRGFETSGSIDWLEWSPDGTRIVLAAATSDTSASLMLFDVRAQRAEPLVEHPSRNVAPAWSPDGLQIVFASDRDGDFDLYLVRVP